MNLVGFWKKLVAKAAPKGAMKPGHKYIRRWWDPKSNRWQYEYYEAEHPNHHHGADALIRRAGPGMVGVAIEYNYDLKEKLKRLGGKWDPKNLVWVFPVERYVERVRPELRHAIYSESALQEISPHLPEGELESSGEPKIIEAKQAAVERAETARYPDGFPKTGLEDRILENIPPVAKGVLKPDQLEDTVRVLSRVKAAADPNAPAGVLLANGTGTGKTFVFGAVIASIRAHPEEYRHLGGNPRPVVVTVSKDLAAQTEGVLQEHFGLTRGQDYDIITYADIRKPGERLKVKGRPLIFDEAHKIKNMFGSSKSQQAEGAKELIFASPFTIYSTATPFDRPWEAKYLNVAPSGRGIARAMGQSTFDNLIERYGVKVSVNRWGGKEYRFMGGVSDLRKFHQDLTRSGFMTQRYLAPEAPVEYAPEPVEIGEEDAALLKEVAKRFSDAPGIVKALGTNLQRAILERAKVKTLIPTVQKELEQGRSVAVFFQFLRDHELKGDELIEALENDEENVSSEAKREFAQRLRGLEISLPSPVRLMKEAFPDLPGGVASYTGNETQKQLREAKEAFNSGKTKLLLLTTAKGGTGLSFHDTVGNRPTTQIVATLPWTAIELDQALGRAVRRGMKSDVRIIFPTASAGVERKLAVVIGERMRTLGYSVRGGAGAIPDEVLDAFTYGAASVDPGAFRKRLEDLEVATPTPSTESTPEAPAVPASEAKGQQVARGIKAEQIPLLPEPTLRTPLFPEVEVKLSKKAKTPKEAKVKKSKPSKPATQPALLNDLPLFQLAKALGYTPGARLVVKAETHNIPVERLRWVDRPKEREELPASHYLLPKEKKFPYRNKDGSINCRLVRAAISRAAQHGYPEVERKARRIYERHCKKKEA